MLNKAKDQNVIGCAFDRSKHNDEPKVSLVGVYVPSLSRIRLISIGLVNQHPKSNEGLSKVIG